jgi:hypothetical protein
VEAVAVAVAAAVVAVAAAPDRIAQQDRVTLMSRYRESVPPSSARQLNI